MGIIDSDILRELIGLPTTGLFLVGAVGAALLVTGWALHRFWLTISISVIAGLAGLRWGTQWGVAQPVVSGLLMAAAGGCMSLSLARIGLFAIFGLSTLWLVQQFAPAYAVPLICVCAGGLFSVLCYGLCIRLLTAGVGTVLLVYGGLAIAHQMKWIDSQNFVQTQQLTLMGSIGGTALIGLLVQLAMSRAYKKATSAAAEEALLKIDTMEQLQQLTLPTKQTWWQKLKRAA